MEHPLQIQNHWAYGQTAFESTAKDIIIFPARAAVVPLHDWLPACVAHDVCNPEDPDALGDDSSFFAVTQRQWRVCVRRMLRCKRACMLSPPSLDPRLASGLFAVAKGEGRDRIIGDRRPLNSRERTIGRAHLPHCPRLRRLILKKSETVQITIRDTRDCFCLYDGPPSRVTTQVIGPRILRSWLEHLDDENWDLIDTDEMENWVYAGSAPRIVVETPDDRLEKFMNQEWYSTSKAFAQIMIVFIISI